jgi:hypothetical protein
MKNISTTRIWAARFVAFGADLLQIGLFPFVIEGGFSALDDALDVLACGILTILVGWHYSFVPSFVLKVVPVADLVPTWTLAVLLATRQRGAETPPVITHVEASQRVPPVIGPPKA